MRLPNVYHGCHDILIMSTNRSDIAMLNISGTDYRCIIDRIRKNEAINLQKKCRFD